MANLDDAFQVYSMCDACGMFCWLFGHSARPGSHIVCDVWNKAIPVLWEIRNLKRDFSVWHREMRIRWVRHKNRCPLTCFRQQHHLLLRVLFNQENKVPSVSALKSSLNGLKNMYIGLCNYIR